MFIYIYFRAYMKDIAMKYLPKKDGLTGWCYNLRLTGKKRQKDNGWTTFDLSFVTWGQTKKITNKQPDTTKIIWVVFCFSLWFVPYKLFSSPEIFQLLCFPHPYLFSISSPHTFFFFFSHTLEVVVYVFFRSFCFVSLFFTVFVLFLFLRFVF